MRRSVVLALAVATIACTRTDERLASHAPEERAGAVAEVAARDDADLAPLLLAQQDPSALVRRTAAEAFADRAGPTVTEALGKLVVDPDPDVAIAAARGLARRPGEARARELLAEAYGRGPAAARAEIADALEAVGGSLRSAVEVEARMRWARDVAALARGSAAERAGAAEELGRSGRTEAVRLLEPLVDLSRAEDARVLAAATRGLGSAGHPSVRPALVAVLDRGPVSIAEVAAESLGSLADPHSAPALARASAGRSPRVAAAAVEALASLPQARGVARALCDVALRSPHPAIAARAAAGARARGMDCPQRPLVDKLARRGPERLAAIAALAELRLSHDAAARVGARLERLLGERDAAVRAAAARALGRLGHRRAAPALVRHAKTAGDRLARERAASGAAVGERDAAAELGAALVAVAELRAGAAARLAAERLADPSEGVRAAAVEALGIAPGEEGWRIAPALADPSPRVRVAAAHALGALGPAGVPPLANAAVDAGPELAGAIARALGQIGAPEAVPALATLARGRAPRQAIASLGSIASPAAVAALLDLLAAPPAEGRAEAIEALAARAPDAAPAIARELTSDRADVRAAAARALGRLRHAAATSRLEALRSDHDRLVRRAAIEAMAKMPEVRSP